MSATENAHDIIRRQTCKDVAARFRELGMPRELISDILSNPESAADFFRGKLSVVIWKSGKSGNVLLAPIKL